jgi:hypothetical protein
MFADLSKRALTWSIPAALISLAIQYRDSRKLNVYAISVTLVAFLLCGVVSETIDKWWKRTAGKNRLSIYASAIFWTVLAICMFVFFRRMQ